MLNMKNISDKELDEIFKQAAEHIEIRYNPSAWEKFERMIDKPGINGVARTVIPIVALFIIMTGAYIWWSIPQYQVDNFVIPTFDQQHISEEISGAGIPGILKENETQRIEYHRQIKVGASLSFNAKQEAPALFLPGNGIFAINAPHLYNLGNMSGTNNIRKDISRASPLSPISITEKKYNLPKSVIHVPTRESRAFKPYFSAGFRVSPDFSGTGISAFSKTGNNMGVSLEYHISPKLSFSTGLIRSRKIYAVTDGFNPYERYWDYKSKPDLIDGGCIVLDIPINIKYNVLAGERSKIFISTGLSSYLMTKENYNYIYYTYQKDYEIRNQNNHFFGILNLSGGYERFVGRQWSLGIEPFVKIPLTDVGYGNLRLMSAGAFISLNYHFSNRRGRP
jgi:hypothetical protein